MNTQTARKLTIVVIAVLFLCPFNVYAASKQIPPYENWYDVKSPSHFKIGYYSVKIYPATVNGANVYKMEGLFHLSFKRSSINYIYESRDSVIVKNQGVVRYEIDENRDGAVRYVSAARKDGKLDVTTYSKKGGTVVDRKSFNVADYDYTHFETRFPMPFERFQIGKVKRSRVFMPSDNRIAVSDTTARQIKDVSWNGETRRILVLETTYQEDEKTTTKTTTWVLENGGFLFHEGEKYSLHLTTKEKALNIR